MILLMLIFLGQTEAERVRTLSLRQCEIDCEAELHDYFDFEQVLSRRNAILLRLLNDDDYDKRWLAEQILTEMGDDAFDTLCWGTHAKNAPMLVHNCTRLMNRCFICRSCKGSGRCPFCEGEDYCSYCDYARRCPSCNGIVDLRWERNLTDGRITRRRMVR